jgi:hypothetical protein
MRIVIKPAGAAMLLLAIGTLVFLLVKKGANPAVAPAGGKPGAVAAAGGGAKPSGGGGGLTPRPRPKGSGQAIIDPLEKKWALVSQEPAKAAMNEFIATDMPGGANNHAVHLDVSAVDSSKYWCAQLIKQVPRPVEAGHNMEVRFWGRSKKNTGVYIVFEEGESPHAAELSKVVSMTPEWKEYTLPFVTTKDHTMVPANFCIKAGIMPGEIDISDVRVADYGK